MEGGDPRVELAVKLAQEAGRHTLAAMGRTQVAWKSPGERVTEVDLAIQTRLVEEIGTWFPGDRDRRRDHHDRFGSPGWPSFGCRYHVGITASTDTFYQGQERDDACSRYAHDTCGV
jgi:hypothetical protein